MIKLLGSVVILSTAACFSGLVNAQPDSPSLQGFSGLFNTPNAYVTTYGTGSVQYSDQFAYKNEYYHNNNFIVNLGIIPHLEISSRVSWFDTHTNCWIADCGIARDLSASFKFNIPFIPEDWFSIAIGEQDTGGEANFFDAKYIVASREFGDIRLNIGVGKNDLDDRLDGVFSGISYQAYEWLSLMVEYDGFRH